MSHDCFFLYFSDCSLVKWPPFRCLFYPIHSNTFKPPNPISTCLPSLQFFPFLPCSSSFSPIRHLFPFICILFFPVRWVFFPHQFIFIISFSSTQHFLAMTLLFHPHSKSTPISCYRSFSSLSIFTDFAPSLPPNFS